MAAMFALVVLVGCVLPWSTIVVADGLPPTSYNAFRDTGILVFLAAMAVLALVTLRLASERPLEIDRLPAYMIILGVGLLGFVLWVLGLFASGPLDQFRPDRAPGIYVVIIGLAGVGRGILEIYQEPDPR
jgi:amino acid transporter